jgi:hypothetical protein
MIWIRLAFKKPTLLLLTTVDDTLTSVIGKNLWRSVNRNPHVLWTKEVNLAALETATVSAKLW